MSQVPQIQTSPGYVQISNETPVAFTTTRIRTRLSNHSATKTKFKPANRTCLNKKLTRKPVTTLSELACFRSY